MCIILAANCALSTQHVTYTFPVDLLALKFGCVSIGGAIWH